MERRIVGKLGEEIACRYLISKSFKIVGRNYLKKCGEIDIVAKKRNVFHFLEVKTVSIKLAPNASSETLDEYRAEDNLHHKKLERFIRVVQIYLDEKKVLGEWEMGAIIVGLDVVHKTAEINFIQNIQP